MAQSKTTSPFTILHESKATPKFELDKKLSDVYGSWMYKYIKNYLILVYEGDAYIDGNLNLDWEMGWVDDDLDWRKSLNIQGESSGHFGVVGLVVTGNLEVNGLIANVNSNEGPFLYVGGDVKAQSVIGGGAYIRIAGDVTATEAVFGHYNDGSLKIGGKVKAPVVISDDHDFGYKSVKADYYYNSHAWGDNEDSELIEDEETGEMVIPPKLTKMLVNETSETLEDVLNDLCAGELILKKTGGIQPERGEAYWLQKVRSNWDNLRRVPAAFKNETVCRAALEDYGGALQYFPPELLTAENCQKAVAQHGAALAFVPKELITRDLCILAAKNHTQIRFFPPELIDYDLLFETVKHSAYQINSIPPEYIDVAMLAEYVKGGDASYLKEFCEKLNISMDTVALKVVETNLENTAKIPGFAFSKTVYEAAEKRYGQTAEWVQTKALHSRDFYKVRASAARLKEIENDPEHKSKYAYAFREVWAVFWDADYCVEVMTYDGANGEYFYFVPDSLKTKLVCEVAFRLDRSNIAHIPGAYITTSMCEDALREYGGNIEYIPESLLTEELCHTAIYDWGEYLKYVPESLRTLAICVAAVRDSSDAMAYVPANLKQAVEAALE